MNFTTLAGEPEVKLVLDEELKSLEKQLQHKPEDVELRAKLVAKVAELEQAYRGICFNSLISTYTKNSLSCNYSSNHCLWPRQRMDESCALRKRCFQTSMHP